MLLKHSKLRKLLGHTKMNICAKKIIIALISNQWVRFFRLLKSGDFKLRQCSIPMTTCKRGVATQPLWFRIWYILYRSMYNLHIQPVWTFLQKYRNYKMTYVQRDGRTDGQTYTQADKQRDKPTWQEDDTEIMELLTTTK